MVLLTGNFGRYSKPKREGREVIKVIGQIPKRHESTQKFYGKCADCGLRFSCNFGDLEPFKSSPFLFPSNHMPRCKCPSCGKFRVMDPGWTWQDLAILGGISLPFVVILAVLIYCLAMGWAKP